MSLSPWPVTVIDDRAAARTTRRRASSWQQPGDAGGRGRLDEDAVAAGELALGGEDLVVGDRARTGRRTRRAAASASFHEAGLPIRIAVAMVSGSGNGSPVTSGAAPSAWKPRITGRLVAVAEVGVLRVAHPVRRDVAGVADRQQVEVGGVAEEVDDLEGRGLLALEPDRVDRVDQRDRVVPGQAAWRGRRQSSKLPRTMITWAPCTIAWASLPAAILPSGTSTSGLSPALAAYAAIEAEVLPVEAQTTASAPSCLATEIATVMPRSLKEPVGLSPSTLSQTSAPVSSESHSETTSGVPPSRSVTAAVPSGISSRSRYSSMTPRHWWVRAAHSAAPSTRITEVTSRTMSMPRRCSTVAASCGVGRLVGDDDELGVVAAALLADGLDRDAVLGERRGDRGEHARRGRRRRSRRGSG